MTTTSIHPGHSVSGVLNHPEWGDGYTERERKRLDAALIEKFAELAGELLGVRLLDHIVVCESSYRSFADEGWL